MSIKRVFKLQDVEGEWPTKVNLRWWDLLNETDFSNDDIDLLSSLCCGETFTGGRNKITRQDS